MVTISKTPQSANLREYCGWTGNTEDDIVTTGTIYHDTASKGYSKSGKRVFKDCYRAEITISGQRYRHRSKDREDCERWLKAVRTGKIKPTDNKADGWRNDTECIDFDNFDEIPKDYWVFGFDTMHYDDGPHLDREWCINETKDLLKQLQEL